MLQNKEMMNVASLASDVRSDISHDKPVKEASKSSTQAQDPFASSDDQEE